MENTITRISDLPAPESQSTGFQNTASTPTNYIPINTHPNPYGNPTQNLVMPLPQQTASNQFQITPPPQSQYLSEEQQIQLMQQAQNRLPSRDIKHDNSSFTQDEQIQPNYIPPSKKRVDFVRDYEDMTEHNIRKHEEKLKTHNRVDAFLNEFQTPIFIAILFFVFQMPLVNTMVFKQFSFLSIYNNDGNFNFFGLIIKSFLFGFAFYTLHKTTIFLSEF